MSASRGVVDVIVRNRVPMKTIARDAPTPSSAVMSGSPAATNDAKVDQQHEVGDHDAEQLGDADARRALREQLAADRDLRAVGERGLERAPASCSASDVDGSTDVVPTDSWIGTSAADPSELRFAARGRRRRARLAAVTCGICVDRRDRVLDGGSRSRHRSRRRRRARPRSAVPTCRSPAGMYERGASSASWDSVPGML